MNIAEKGKISPPVGLELTTFELEVKHASPLRSFTNLRSGVPYIFCHGVKVRLIQLLDYFSVASPESGLFSDWSRNKR